MALLTTALARTAAADPALTAVIDHGRRVSYAELDLLSRRAAAWLLRAGVVPGETLGITVEGGLANLVLTYGTMLLGCPQVPLASFEPAAMRDALARRCGVRRVLTDRPDLPIESAGALPVDFEAIRGDASLEPPSLPPVDPGHPAVILSSSGTTGRPKLVAVSQAQVAGYGDPGVPDGAVGLHHYSVESNAGKWARLVSLALGQTLVFDDVDRIGLAELCARHGIRRVHVYPAKLEALVRAAPPAEAFRDVHFVVGGSTIGAALREAVRTRVTPNLYVAYGATECGIVSVAEPATCHGHPDTVGRVLEGVDVRIVDDAGRELPRGEAGFIRIRSLWSATGYLDDPEATARMFRDGWFQPGDVASITADGLLTVMGRGDDMMQLNTFNVFPAEIEAVAGRFEGVRECAAFARRGSAYGDIPLLAVVAAPGIDREALTRWCRDRLGTRAPRKVFLVDSIPRNALGKVLRVELEKRFGAGE